MLLRYRPRMYRDGSSGRDSVVVWNELHHGLNFFGAGFTKLPCGIPTPTPTKPGLRKEFGMTWHVVLLEGM